MSRTMKDKRGRRRVQGFSRRAGLFASAAADYPGGWFHFHPAIRSGGAPQNWYRRFERNGRRGLDRRHGLHGPNGLADGTVFHKSCACAPSGVNSRKTPPFFQSFRTALLSDSPDLPAP